MAPLPSAHLHSYTHHLHVHVRLVVAHTCTCTLYPMTLDCKLYTCNVLDHAKTSMPLLQRISYHNLDTMTSFRMLFPAGAHRIIVPIWGHHTITYPIQKFLNMHSPYPSSAPTPPPLHPHAHTFDHAWVCGPNSCTVYWKLCMWASVIYNHASSLIILINHMYGCMRKYVHAYIYTVPHMKVLLL